MKTQKSLSNAVQLLKEAAPGRWEKARHALYLNGGQVTELTRMELQIALEEKTGMKWPSGLIWDAMAYLGGIGWDGRSEAVAEVR